MKNIMFAMLLAILLGCSDFLEKDISNRNVKLLSPSDNSRSSIFSQKLKWEEIDGALTYKLEIVSPSFTSITSFIQDTIISQTEFIYTFQPGDFQWRVKAMNGSSETNFSIFNLSIDTTSDLSKQSVLIQSPLLNSYSNKQSTVISWSSLYNATSYQVQVAMPDFSTSAYIVMDTVCSFSSVSLNIAEEAKCQVRVRAINSRGTSSYSTPVSFETDYTPPNIPVLLLPSNNSTITNPVKLYWDRGITNGSPVRDSVYIYSDTLITKVRYNGTSYANYNDSLAAGTYFWRIRSFDAAGNSSQYSSPRKFHVQ